MPTTINKKRENLLGEMFKGSKNALRWIEETTKTLDKNNVLLYKIPYTRRFNYYPTFIARYGLGNLEMFLETGEEKYKKYFFAQVNWLCNNLVYKNGFAVWEHHYIFPYYQFDRIPWIHGLGQGLGMTALLKAYQLSGVNRYLEAAKKVYNSFEISIKKGGVKFVDDEGNVWLEEYAILPPPHILNGFITILFSINEFYQVTKDESAFEIWDKGINTLKNNLKRYDTGYWSLYDLLNKYPAPLMYHDMHVHQLGILYRITGEKIFKDYELRWKNYMECKKNRMIAKFSRGIIHLRRHGIIGSAKRYIQRKRWERGD